MKNIKKGMVIKNGEELLLLAGSKIITTNIEGQVKEFILSSDSTAILEHDTRLFPTK